MILCFYFHLGMHTTNDRQRARSLSSVPDLQASHNNHEAMSIPPNGGSSSYAVATQSGSHEDNASVNALALGRVFTATSLPSHIWSWNGKFEFSFCLFFISTHSFA